MTRQETAALLAVVRLLWPHSNLGSNPMEVLGLWHGFLTELDADAAEAAVRELAAQGREHAPPVGLVAKVAADRATAAPDWDEVRAEILHAVATYRPPAGVQADPYAPPPAGYWSHPILAAFMDGAWSEWRAAKETDGTFNAQQREAWRARASRAERAHALTIVGAPRQRELARPDYRQAIPAPRRAA